MAIVFKIRNFLINEYGVDQPRWFDIVKRGEFDESKHPRWPKGSEHPGAFAPAGAYTSVAGDIAGRLEPESGQIKIPKGALKPAKGNYAKGSGKRNDPVKTNDVDVAARALGLNLWVELDSEPKVGTLLDRIVDMVKEAEAKGEEKPKFNLCRVSVPHTNIFCADTKGIPRARMPQFAAKPTEGTPADKFPKNAKGEVNIGQAFCEDLQSKGYKVTNKNIPSEELKASQMELDGAKVAGMYKAIREGKMQGAPPIYTTSDGYVLDGHHRWAAQTAYDRLIGKESTDINVIEVDVPIIRAIGLGNKFAKKMGIPQQKM